MGSHHSLPAAGRSPCFSFKTQMLGKLFLLKSVLLHTLRVFFLGCDCKVDHELFMDCLIVMMVLKGHKPATGGLHCFRRNLSVRFLEHEVLSLALEAMIVFFLFFVSLSLSLLLSRLSVYLLSSPLCVFTLKHLHSRQQLRLICLMNL